MGDDDGRKEGDANTQMRSHYFSVHLISLPRNYATHFERRARASLQISAGMGAAPERGEQRAGTLSSDWMSHKIQKSRDREHGCGAWHFRF